MDGAHLNNMKNKKKALYRQQMVGFVFQDFNLLPTMTNKENIMMPLILAGAKRKDITKGTSVGSTITFRGILKTISSEISGVRSNALPLHVH